MTIETRVNAAIDQAIGEKRIVGAVVMVARGNELVFSRAAGLADRESGQPVAADTIFRLASVTKPIVAMTALVMMEKGLFSLDDRVSDYLPWFHPTGPDGAPADIRLHHLLTHTAGLDYTGGAGQLPPGETVNTGLTDTDLTFEQNFSRLNHFPLAFAPGTAWAYSVAIDILGAMLSSVAGVELEAVIRQHVADPLGMDDTRFSVTDARRLATPYGDGAPEPVRMGTRHTVHDAEGIAFTFEPSRIFNPRAYQSGGAGMAGTAGDFLKLLRDLLRPHGLLTPETASAALSTQTGTLAVRPGKSFGYVGSVVVNPAEAGTVLPEGAVTWGGVYGNCWALDPASGTAAVIMTNTAVEGCNGAFPEEIWRAIFAA